MATYSKPVRRKRAMPQIGRRQNRLDQPNCRQSCRMAGFALHSIRRVQAVKRSARRRYGPTNGAHERIHPRAVRHVVGPRVFLDTAVLL